MRREPATFIVDLFRIIHNYFILIFFFFLLKTPRRPEKQRRRANVSWTYRAGDVNALL